MKHSREDIIEGGIQLFRVHGYQGTGIQQILQSLDIPKGSFYNYFKSKEEFVIEAVSLYGKNGLQKNKEILRNRSVSPLNRILKQLEQVQKVYIAESFEKSCLLDILAIEISGINKKVARIVNKVFEERKVIYAKCIKEGQEQGEIRVDEKAQDLAEFLLTGYSGAQLKAKTEKSIRPMKVFVKQYVNYIER
ncbi:MAG: hypothetical protein COA57_04115 [Flavobacteriales bacterium]|nr:MAG: hypothetical protein COA57_04115 [Flavobacteriales bacterium]